MSSLFVVERRKLAMQNTEGEALAKLEPYRAPSLPVL
jgi:hypothetical protein